MGDCVSSTSDSKNLSRENRLPTLLQKIRITLEQQMMKRGKSLQQQQFNLYHSFLNDKVNRSVTVEKAMIGRTVYYKNINQIYFICATQCKIILDRKGAIESNIQMVQASMQTLVYCASILKEDLLYELQQNMRTYNQFKFPTDQDVRHDLIRQLFKWKIHLFWNFAEFIAFRWKKLIKLDINTDTLPADIPQLNDLIAQFPSIRPQIYNESQ